MALTAQQVYNQSLALQRGRVGQMYGRNLEMLAREMRNRSEQLEANLEGRGVFRSGEANTARERLKEDEAAQRRYYSQDRDYQMSQLDIDEQSRLASSGGGTSSSAMATTGGRTPEQIYQDMLKNSGFAVNAPKPVGQRLQVITRKPGTVQTTRQRAM